jgi:hypothetical protein
MAKGIPALIALLGLFSSANAWSQAPDNLPDYVPLLPAVKAKALAADPQKGYLVRELKPGIFMITDGAYESVFVTTGKGVVLFDAPPSLAQHIRNCSPTSRPVRGFDRRLIGHPKLIHGLLNLPDDGVACVFPLLFGVG